MIEIDAKKCEEHILAARSALFDADLALAMRDFRNFAVQIDMAGAHIGVCKRTLQGQPTSLPPDRG